MSIVISEVEFGDKDKIIRLVKDSYDSSKNVITILIGRNGSGKSNLLKKICNVHIFSCLNIYDWWYRGSYRSRRIEDFLDYREHQRLKPVDISGKFIYKIDNKKQCIEINKGKSNIQNIGPYKVFVSGEGLIEGLIRDIPKILAVSSSPFDKFPLLDQHRLGDSSNELKDTYKYLGAKTTNQSGKSYIKAKFNQLGASFINFFLRAHETKVMLTHLFDYLRLEYKITIQLTFAGHFSPEDNRDPSETVKSARFFKDRDHDEELTLEEREKVLTSIEKIRQFMNKDSERANRHGIDYFFSIELDVNNLSASDPELIENLSILTSYDLFDLKDIEFTKKGTGTKFLLTEASSGELCTLFTIVAIAGEIIKNAVILIDEPEISLHPEWQSDFIPLIKKIFGNYSGCHFIIATHSAQILSSLDEENSFVVRMDGEEPTLFDGKEFRNHSSDFQLAEAFEYPGSRNEYLISELVEILSMLSEQGEIGENLKSRIAKILRFYDLVPKNDPVSKLISTLKKAIKVLEK